MYRGFGSIAFSRPARAAIAGLVVLVGLTACLDDTPTSAGTTKLRANLSATVVGSFAGGTVRIRVGYRTTREQFIALPSSPQEVPVAAGATVVVPVMVDIGPCLLDGERVLSAEPGCLLTIELTLSDASGTPIDTQIRDAGSGPATPGGGPVDFGTVTIGVSVSTITVAPPSLGMNVAEEQRLVATVRDAAGAVTTALPVTWNTTDGTVVQLTPGTAGSVTVRALKLGTASVTATAGGKSSSPVAVSVVPPAPLVVRQRQGAGCILVGQTINLDVDSPPGAITWTSANPSAASVSAAGVVTGIIPGSVVITATSGARTGTATVCVTGPLRIVAANISVVAGQSVQIATTGVTGGALSYVSDAPGIATVDASGVVRGVSLGTANVTVTFTAPSGTDSQPVRVTVTAAGVAITPTTANAGLGRTTRFTVVVKDASGASIPGSAATWTINDPTVGSLSAALGASVNVRALKLGSTIVRATAGGVTGTAQFVASQALPASRLEKVAGDGVTCPTRSTSCTFVVRALDANGAPVPGASVSWASNIACGSPKLVASDNNGLATTSNLCSNIAAGTYTQTATLVSNGAQVSFSFSLRGLVLTLQNVDSFGNYIYSVTSPSGAAAGLTASVAYRSGQVTDYVSVLALNGATTPAVLTVGYDPYSLPIGEYTFDLIVSTTTSGIGPGVETITFFVDSGGFVSRSNARRTQPFETLAAAAKSVALRSRTTRPFSAVNQAGPSENVSSLVISAAHDNLAAEVAIFRRLGASARMPR